MSAGRYWITLLGARAVACGQATTGTFTRGRGPTGCRVKPVTQPSVGLGAGCPGPCTIAIGQTCTARTEAGTWHGCYVGGEIGLVPLGSSGGQRIRGLWWR